MFKLTDNRSNSFLVNIILLTFIGVFLIMLLDGLKPYNELGILEYPIWCFVYLGSLYYMYNIITLKNKDKNTEKIIRIKEYLKVSYGIFMICLVIYNIFS